MRGLVRATYADTTPTQRSTQRGSDGRAVAGAPRCWGLPVEAPVAAPVEVVVIAAKSRADQLTRPDGARSA
jgi:hypothetical protein